MSMGQLQPPGIKSTASGVNPFARALNAVELEKSTTPGQNPTNPNTSLSEALARLAGSGTLPENFPTESNDAQHELEHAQMQARHRELLEKVNPVDQFEVYRASEKRTQQQLEEVRRELSVQLAQQPAVAQTHTDLGDRVFEKVTVQGINTGSGLMVYYQKIRAHIIRLTELHHSRIWLQQQEAKSAAKKKRNHAPGLEISGKQHEQGKTIFDMMHHEVSTAYSGG